MQSDGNRHTSYGGLVCLCLCVSRRMYTLVVVFLLVLTKRLLCKQHRWFAREVCSLYLLVCNFLSHAWSLSQSESFKISLMMALRLWLLVKSYPQGAKPPCCIFVLESHRGANQPKCWSRLSSCTLDLALVIGHALFDWDKVITCYLFKHCPLQSAACTQGNVISAQCLYFTLILLILMYCW